MLLLCEVRTGARRGNFMLSSPHLLKTIRQSVCLVAFVAAIALPVNVGWAGAPSVAEISAKINEDLADAAQSGPRALIARLEGILRANPQMAADAATAADLGSAAARPVSNFIGSNVPVYRDIIARIIGAAPEAKRAEIGAAVGRAVRQIASTDPMVRQPLVKDIETLLAEAQARAERASQQRGIRVGDFILYPEIQVTEFYDDNIFATKDGKTSDYATVIGPHLFVHSDWEKHYVRMQAHYDGVRFRSNQKENTDDLWFSGEGRYDFTQDTNVFGGLLAGRLHEDRSSPDDVNGSEPTIYYERRVYGGGSHQVGKTTLRAGATFEQTRFDDTPTSSGIDINNSDRDWDHITAGPSLSYKLNDTFVPYIQALADIRDYRSQFDDAGVDRDSAGYHVLAGTEFRVSGALDGKVFSGYQQQNYDDAALKDVGVLMVGGDLRWRLVPSTQINMWVDRSVEETSLTGASAYVYSAFGGSVNHSLTDDLDLIFRASYGVSDFVGAGREDDDYEVSTTLRYLITENYYVAGDYRLERRVSDVSAANYSRNLVYFRIGAQY